MKIYKEIKKAYENILLKLVDDLLPVQRKRKYVNKYFLEQFKNILQHFRGWKSLTKSKDYPAKVQYHYKYLNEVFNKWSDYIYKAYDMLMQKYYFKLTNLSKSKALNLFVDCTYITNKYGTEMIAKNPEYKKKKVTKLTVISDQHKNILSATYTNVALNETKKCLKFDHDVKTVQQTLDASNLVVPKYVNIKLVGDKGFITQQLFNYNDKQLKMIAPKRKNQKAKNTKNEKKILNKRYVIENVNSNFKNAERVFIRKDKKIQTFMSFVYLSFLELFCLQNKLYDP